MGKIRQRMQEQLQLLSRSPSTIETYLKSSQRLVRFYHRAPDQLTREEVRSYLVHLLQDCKLARSTFNTHCFGLKFLFVQVLERPDLWPKIPFRKPRKKLPMVLSRGEVFATLLQAHNIKHRAMLATLYATGIRLAELLHLRLTDIESDRGMLRAPEGPGQGLVPARVSSTVCFAALHTPYEGGGQSPPYVSSRRRRRLCGVRWRRGGRRFGGR